MTTLFLILQIILSCVLVALILLQSKGGGLGSAFGGNSGTYSTRRGVEVVLFRFTIAVAALFFLISAIRLFV